MASQIFTNPLYLLPRTGTWALLFVLALLDGLRNRHENARARKLYAGVVLVLAAFVVQDVLLLLYSLLGFEFMFSIYIFFTDLADAMFIALLLTIAAGFCITREDLGPYRQKVIYIPIIYFVTILVVDYVMNATKGVQAFNVADYQAGEVRLPGWQSFLLVVCAFVNLMALMAAWVYTFDTVSKEREMLEQPETDVYGATEPGLRHPHGQQPSDQAAAGAETGQADGSGSGHAVLQPPELAGQEDVPNTYGEITGEDLDGPKTVEEKVAKFAKVKLLRQFSYGVIAYVVATALVVLLPIFVPPDQLAGETAIRTVLILQNVVLWVFMAGLAWIFRLRGDSPYLMMTDDETAQSNTDQLETQLGVLGEEGSGRDSPQSQGSMQNFALHDIEDDDPASLAEAGRHPSPAQQQPPDPRAEAPKAPMLKGVPRSDQADS